MSNDNGTSAIQRRGLMLVLSSPSGAGKTTLSRQLLDNDKQTFMRRLEETIETASDRLIAEFSGRPYTPSQLVLRSQGQTGIGQPITAPRAAL